MKNLIIVFAVMITSAITAQEFDYLPTSTTNQIIKHTYYTLSFSEKYKLAEWATYKLTPEMVNGSLKPMNDYRSDPSVADETASLADYNYSGYVKAHLVPVADMKIDETAMSECFYMSNISPQVSSFNKGSWKHLEEQVRNWTTEKGELYVVSGAILSNSKGHFGATKVSIPGEYYKVVLITEPDFNMIGFVMRNEKSYSKLESFVVNIDEIETRTGIDFFPELPDGIEEDIESRIDKDFWFSGSKSKATSTAVQCMGIGRTSLVRCKNKTTNPNGYCKLHQNQVNDSLMVEEK